MSAGELGAFAGLRVMVVEDEILVAMMLEDILSECFGCIVVAHHSRVEPGLEAARTLALDAAFLDLNLRGRSSLPIAEALRARGVPVLFTSGYDQGSPKGPGGSVDMVSKPYTPQEIGEALVRALGRKS